VRAGPIRSLIAIIQTRRRAGLTGESLERSAVMLGTQARRGTNRGRDARYRTPPAQIPASPIRALGSYLGCVTAKRTSGQG
jgi:hypothetical protein